MRGKCFLRLDIPTKPYYGRRPDFAHYTTKDAEERIDWEADRVLGVPSPVIEVVSPKDPRGDFVTKVKEYAEAGIRHYWIIDPTRRLVLTMRLAIPGHYAVSGEYTEECTLTCALFPDLKIPLRELFWSRKQ